MCVHCDPSWRLHDQHPPTARSASASTEAVNLQVDAQVCASAKGTRRFRGNPSGRRIGEGDAVVLAEFLFRESRRNWWFGIYTLGGSEFVVTACLIVLRRGDQRFPGRDMLPIVLGVPTALANHWIEKITGPSLLLRASRP